MACPVMAGNRLCTAEHMDQTFAVDGAKDSKIGAVGACPLMAGGPAGAGLPESRKAVCAIPCGCAPCREYA